jgi:drug/metabolite transporter, DME family
VSATTHRVQLIAAAALFSTGGAAIKATELGGWQIASFRSGIAALALVLLLPAARRGWNGRVLLVGVAYAATLVLFVLANRLTTAANTIFLQSTAPLYLLLLGPLVLREPIRRQDFLFMLAVGGGLVLFFAGSETPVATAPDPVRGNVLAALSGVCWAFTVVGLRWMGRQPEGGGSPLATVVAGNLIAFLACLPMALPVPAVAATDWLVVAYLGVFQIGLAYYLMTAAIRHVPALEAATLLLVEPALNPIWAWLAHGERPSNWALAGGALILGATLLKTWWDGRALPPPRRLPDGRRG